MLFPLYHESPTDIMKQDWDNLIILDACRYDKFCKISNFDGTLSKVVSQGSHSSEFISNTFTGEEFHDTIYISANPYASKQLIQGVFYKTVRSYDTKNSWSKNVMKHHPDNVCELAKENYKENKRIIVHFMQPHTPYFGSYADQKRKELLSENIVTKRDHNLDQKCIGIKDENIQYYTDILDVARKTDCVSNEELNKCYEENLKYVLQYVHELINHFDGKTVITSDHGEMLGNPSSMVSTRKYRHPKNYWTPEVRVVPWLEIESNSRRQITSETPEPITEVSEEELEQQLYALGYK